MAKNKKGFVLYADQHELFSQLTDEQAGKLIKHVFRYVNDEDPQTDDIIINLAFTPIKQQLKRDLKKYEDRAERSRSNGLKGGRPKTQKTQQVKKEPRKPDTVKDTVKDKDIYTMPAYSDFKEYAYSKKKNLDPEALKLKYDSWVDNGWKNGNDKPIKNWKTTLLNTIPYIKTINNHNNIQPQHNLKDLYE
jgi:hypothetical protein